MTESKKDGNSAGGRSASKVAAGKSSNGARQANAKGNGNSRPSVVPLNYPDKDTLQRAYMSFVKGGGLFMPTNVSYEMNEEIFLLVSLPGSKKALPVPGTVVWQSPSSSADGRRPGVGIEFKGREGNSLRNTIEGILGARVSGPDPTYTM
jgi:type IV pilus assembly protein PilZ